MFEEDLIIADINPERVFHERLHDPRRRPEKLDVMSDGLRVDRVMLRERGAEPSTRKPLENGKPPESLSRAEEVYLALVTGTRDYVRKNGFESVVIGLSGGIDSALTACVAVDALGADHVTCVFMPTRFSSSESGRTQPPRRQPWSRIPGHQA
jgi:NAD+ synthase (glutamine-hydrolysing)